jgi:regulatory protein
VADQESLALALGELARKERSVAELHAWLRRRGVGEEEAAGVIDDLVSVDALDDARFSRRFAEDKRALSGWGRERIAAALRERGVGEADLQTALASEDAEEELKRAVGLLEGRGAKLGDDRGRSRALGLLVRRGFDSETAYEAIRRAGAGAG